MNPHFASSSSSDSVNNNSASALISSSSETVLSKQVQLGLEYVQACHNGFQTESYITLKLTAEDKDILWSLLKKDESLKSLIHKLKQAQSIFFGYHHGQMLIALIGGIGLHLHFK